MHSPRASEGEVSLPAWAPASCSRTGGGAAVPAAAAWLENGGWQPMHAALSKDLQALLYQALSWLF